MTRMRIERWTLRCLQAVSLASASLMTFFANGAAHAQDAAEDRAQSFRAVQGAVKEDVAGGPLLLVAYGLILAVLVGYLARLVRLQQRAEGDLARLERQLGQAGSQPKG